MVVAAWPLFLLLFHSLYGTQPTPAGLMLLALPVAGVAHLIRWVPPWLTTLMALVPAALVAPVCAALWPGGVLWAAYGVAAAVLVYRFVQARQVRAALGGEEQPARLRAREGGQPVAVTGDRPRRPRSRWRRPSANSTA